MMDFENGSEFIIKKLEINLKKKKKKEWNSYKFVIELLLFCANEIDMFICVELLWE